MKIDLPQAAAPPRALPYGDGDLGVNSRFFTCGGRAVAPVMGEFHYSRYPSEFWREELAKMKAGGVGIIATYIFWLHHEEIEGKFDWSGQRSLRGFIEACRDVGLPILLRIGPWAHGECRNGGFPDWLMRKDWELRSDDPDYLRAAEKLYREIFSQAEGLLWKDGGPVIGVQLENEYGHCGGFAGEKGAAHMRTLKRLALEAGFDVPFYTATGWGGAVVVDGEMLPVLGAYVDAPWAQHTDEMPANDNFIFSNFRNDSGIGADLAIDPAGEFTYDVAAYPYATAELGAGLQVTSHRRTVVPAIDAESMILCKLGSGANLIGYYMYHGGTNPEGKLSTLQESRATGYLNDLPELSYDFQAPLGEFGEMRESFGRLRKLHLFMRDFGEVLADTATVIPPFSAKDPEDVSFLRVSARLNAQGSGFLFINHHQRHRALQGHPDVRLTVGEVEMPPFAVTDGFMGIFPVNLPLGDAVLECSNAQPLCRLGDGYVFFTASAAPVYRFAKGGAKIHTLSVADANRAYRHGDTLYIADGCVYEDGGLTLLSREPQAEVRMLTPQGMSARTVSHPPIAPQLSVTPIGERADGSRGYELTIEGASGAHECYLALEFDGDVAELHLDGQKISDRFYTGLVYEVGLKRFGYPERLTLWVSPLREDAAIYLERRPEYVGGTACALKGARLIPEYAIRL